MFDKLFYTLKNLSAIFLYTAYYLLTKVSKGYDNKCTLKINSLEYVLCSSNKYEFILYFIK